MTIAAVERWVEEPLKRFVDDARVQTALLLNPTGQVLAQYGFARSLDVMAACALAAAIHATAAELGLQMEGKPFSGSHQAGREKQIFLAPLCTRQGTHLLLTVFDSRSSIGLVRLYFADLGRALALAAPEAPAGAGIPAADFERELNRNIAVLFGRA